MLLKAPKFKHAKTLVSNITPASSDDTDVIVFSVHEQGYKQCSDEPVGTYITPVPNFLEGYLKYYLQIQQDKGYDDYELPDAANYAYCTRTVKNGNEYWVQVGCADDSSQSLAVNIYSDNTCTTRSSVDGYDDSNIDVSEIQVGFCAESGFEWKAGLLASPLHTYLSYFHSHRLRSAKPASCGSTRTMML